MGKLNLAEKLHTIVHAATLDPPLSATAVRTLAYLIYRHNSKTGQCDPSIQTIAADIHASERMVRRGISDLAARRLLTVSRKSVRGRNSYSIQVRRPRLTSRRRTPMTEEVDTDVPENRSQSAADKEKDKSKDKMHANDRQSEPERRRGNLLRNSEEPDCVQYPRLQIAFESAVLKEGAAFELTYEDLLRLDERQVEMAFRETFFDKRKWHANVNKIVQTCLAARRR